MGIILGITSGKGGTGKSTVAAGLGFAISEGKKSVLLVDLDEGLRCLDVLIGIDNQTVYDLGDVLCGMDYSSAIYASPAYSGLYVMPAPASVGTITVEGLKKFTENIKDKFDAVIFDFPAGANLKLYSALGKTAQFITVCNMDCISVRDASVIERGLPDTVNEPRLIINKFNLEYVKSGTFGNIDSIIDGAATRLLGIVPVSMELSLLSNNHGLSRKGKANLSFIRIARRLFGEDVKLPEIKKI